MRGLRIIALGLLVQGLTAISGCSSIAEPPFVWMDPKVTVNKQMDQLRRFSRVQVCHNDGDVETAIALALATCAEYGLKGYELKDDRYQCKVSAPHRLSYRCYDPQMSFANGAWVNTFNKPQVKLWQEEQMKLTGKPLSELYPGPTRAVPEDIERLDVDQQMELDAP